MDVDGVVGAGHHLYRTSRHTDRGVKRCLQGSGGIVGNKGWDGENEDTLFVGGCGGGGVCIAFYRERSEWVTVG